MGVYSRTSGGKTKWYAELVHEGQRVRSKLYPQKWQAQEHESRVRRSIQDGTFDRLHGKHRVPTLEEAMRVYLRECKDRDKQGTLDSKTQHARLLVEKLGQHRVDEVTLVAIHRLRDELRKDRSGPTVNRYMATLSGCMRSCVERGYLERNPVREVRRYPENKDRMRIPSEAQVREIVGYLERYAEPEIAVAVGLLYETGMRVRELLNTKVKDYVSPNLLRVEKGKTGGRTVPLNILASHAVGVLTNGRRGTDEDGPLIPNPFGKGRLRYTPLRYHFQKACSNLGLPRYRLHDLRHAAATRYIRLGASPKAVQKLLGHKTSAMLDRYVHMTSNDAARVVALADGSGVDSPPESPPGPAARGSD